MSEDQLQDDFDLFYEDVFMELASFGEVEEMVVCDNVGDHLVGNVYCQYRLEESAGNAVTNLNNRFYAGNKYILQLSEGLIIILLFFFFFVIGRPLYAELSPVTDFREACCRQHEISECNRGGFCNFMHLKHPSRPLRRELYEGQRLDVREKRREEMRREDGERRRSRDRDYRHERQPPQDYRQQEEYGKQEEYIKKEDYIKPEEYAKQEYN
jgi:splicing factor U2AF subunit